MEGQCIDNQVVVDKEKYMFHHSGEWLKVVFFVTDSDLRVRFFFVSVKHWITILYIYIYKHVNRPMLPMVRNIIALLSEGRKEFESGQQ
jgi:hypothetical protein